MKIFQNKTFVGGVCIVLAAIFAFLLLPSMNKKKGETQTVYKLKTSVSAGTQITEEMLDDKEVGSYGLPETIVKNKDDIIGKYTNCSISAEDYILTTKLSEFAADAQLDKVSANGHKLITITILSVAAGVGNHIKAGDIVSVYSFIDGKTVIFDELRNLEIYSIENDDGENLEEAQKNEDAEKIAATATLIVNDSQAEKLVLAEYSGKLHIVFERRGGV
ncbi:MAG: hypothetical protein BWY15_02030 [Firmicutes bacterium ADurb.Bin193]|nr:MAG: hypothetical protein BWY15_02030 [Firmicutes bacterium ADurb.Bin193]